jgi:hypothetical protein
MSQAFPNKQYRPKLIRERWINHVDPNIKRDPWTVDEDLILLQKTMEIGLKWKDLSAFLPGRHEHAVKNHYFSL